MKSEVKEKILSKNTCRCSIFFPLIHMMLWNWVNQIYPRTNETINKTLKIKNKKQAELIHTHTHHKPHYYCSFFFFFLATILAESLVKTRLFIYYYFFSIGKMCLESQANAEPNHSTISLIICIEFLVLVCFLADRVSVGKVVFWLS